MFNHDERQVIYDEINVDDDFDACTLGEISDNVDDLIKKYGKDVRLNLEVYNDWGDEYATALLYITREETDEEFEKRKKRNQLQRDHQYQEYLKLKEKFGE